MTHGYSLLELLIAMSIMAILALVAIPSYHAVIQKTDRQQAQVALMQLNNDILEYFDKNSTYSGFSIDNNTDQMKHLKEKYLFTLRYSADQQYVLSAQPIGSQSLDNCGTLRVNALGIMRAKSQDCWL